MKKNIIIAMLLFLIVQLFASAAIAGQTATDSADTFKIRLPDGLYLYQPWTNWYDYFSPLIIIEDSRLINPYALLKKHGKKLFEKKYLKGRQFKVFVGKEPVGKLSGMTLYKRDCDTKAFLPFYSAKGVYEGGPLPAVEDPTGNFDRFNTLKAVAAPRDIGLAVAKDEFTVTEEDRALADAVIKKELTPSAVRRIEKLYNIKGHITNDEGKLDSLIAVDIDGNGKKDLLGIYTVYGSGIPDPISEHTIKHTIGGSSEMLFVVWDTDKAEEVMSYEYGWPAFSLGGLIDIDKDGVQELIVQKSVIDTSESVGEGIVNEGVEINILRHTPSGWENIYRSGNVCADIVH